MNNRGRNRSQAQRAGTSNAYNNTTADLIKSNNPPSSDVNLLLQSEDWTRAGLFYRAHNAYNQRLDPIPYIESQLWR